MLLMGKEVFHHTYARRTGAIWIGHGHKSIPVSGMVFVAIAVLLLFSCRSSPSAAGQQKASADAIVRADIIQRAYRSIDSLVPAIESGDLILRKGNDFTSESLGSLNQRDASFSHCGIASLEHDSVFVYHALGGEFNPDQKIRRDPLTVFAEPEGNRAIAQYRYHLPPDSLHRITQTAQAFYKAGLMFDMKFNLTTDDRLYCAEFVYKVIRQATGNQLVFNISHIDTFRFIGVDDLFLQPRCRELKRIVYK